MTAYVFDQQHRAHLLPELTGWDIVHTTGGACGAFSVTCLYEEAMLPVLKQASRFRAYHKGMPVFTGVVDRYDITWDARGKTVTLRGRSPAALLMDNESRRGDYVNVDLEYMLQHHVRPWGVTDIVPAAVKPLARFTVRSGQSEWNVLREFLEFSGGLCPRFTADGKLLLDGTSGGALRVVGGSTPILSAEFTDDRCGVISEILVQKTRGAADTVKNEAFLARGGSAHRVLNVPRALSYDAMRYTGEYQIRRSKENSVTCTLTLPALFEAFAGDTVRLDANVLGLTGSFRVNQSRCWARGSQYGTELTLAVWEVW